RSKPDLLFLEFSGFYILFNLQLSRFSVLSACSAATFISYHSRLCLSTTFFNFFLIFVFDLILSFQKSSAAFSPAGINHITVVIFCQQLF
ncbi:hypothetical protein, partial [Enterocloster hominis (ex Hitch et al. 2024)]